MNIKNTSENYGVIAKWLHWTTALLFLVSYISVYYRQWFTEAKTPENWNALHIHFSVGITIAIIVLLRVIWRVMNRAPTPEPGTKKEHLAAHIGHYSLYAIMVILPITGYIGTGINTEFFFWFEAPKFESTQLFTYIVIDGLNMTFKEFEVPIDYLHKNILGAWLAWMLIVGHICAALYHHLVKKDRTLKKMTSGK